MFDEKLFFELCEECGVEMIDNPNDPKLLLELNNGEVVELTDELFDTIIGNPCEELLENCEKKEYHISKIEIPDKVKPKSFNKKTWESIENFKDDNYAKIA